jgi:endonuclease/exonuclease/phosphatase family metal-dependent hydrolase
MGWFKKISNRILMIINVIVVVLFLLACINPKINPKHLPLVSLIGLAFPFLLFIVLFFLVWWIFVKRRWALVSAIAIVIGGGQITNFFAFNFFASSFKYEKNENHIRVATWNVARFIEMIKNNNQGSQTRYKMLQQIKQVNADILCLQEFSSSINPDWYNNIVAVSKGLNYPYYYFSHDWDGDRLFNGSVIFSRFPIIDTGMVRFSQPTLPEALVFADIKINSEQFRIYTTHLQSNQFKKEDISKIEELKDGKDVFGNVPHIFSKLEKAIELRAIQADMVAAIIKNSASPVIFCGDLNDVPNSYTYNMVRGNLQDAFLKKGSGIGRTYHSISPTLRIDYIFADEKLKIDQFKRITTNYSDHYMIVADVQLK